MRLSLFAAAALCVSNLAAHAGSITQSLNTGPFTTATSNGGYAGDTLTAAGFNPTLGKLTSIGITYSGSYTVTSQGAANGQGNTSDIYFYLGENTNGVPAFGGFQEQYEKSLGVFSLTKSTSDSSAAALSFFTNSGSVAPVFAYADALLATDISTNFNISLTYNYTDAPPVIAATPEPSSIALLGTGLLGMAGVIRKRFA